MVFFYTKEKKKSSNYFFPNIFVEKTTIIFEKIKIIFVIV